LSQKAHTIFLSNYNLILQSPEKEEVIPYANITAVQLSKVRKQSYAMRLTFENHGTVVITNKYFLPTGECEDRSRHYTTFVRVLHFHLKDKSFAAYNSGLGLRHLLIWSLYAAFLSFSFSFISEFYEFSVVNPFVQALGLTIITVIGIVVLNRGQWPKAYSPSNIPLRFLPSDL
jgi:hypothetical protein